MSRILVTGAGAVLGQGIIKSLRSGGSGWEIIAADPNPLSVGLYWADQACLIPMASDPAYADAIEDLLEVLRPHAVLVGTDVELAIFASRREEWERRFATRILVSDPETIEIADDKYATARFLARHGLDHPLSALPEDAEGLEFLIDRVGFPLIVKPRRGARAVGVSLVSDRADLALALTGRSGLVVQQLAGPDDQEYTAGVLFFEDEVKASIVLRRDLRDGNTYRAFVGEYPDCDAYVRSVAEALRPYGPANFQFRKGADGRCRLFEINARFSGTTPMRALAGFNEVDLCLRHLLHGKAVPPCKARPGVILRFLDEQFIAADHLISAGAS
ncbi:carbamoyl-phosphate synthase large subunit [Novosphingobium hassiacum]|uniref:Carbamoyl-phosphate synthase large subunit n=1 Tax=Novosphingobium hassiacum TaxID=173676 RepID=A0A7W6A157_9SPHN|nr:ATP-grasp domain-containing protein [Novosphingobium hassiacum]MBB3862572.1 carbamoyl-phosphate synthase large subunit [Novosphingobium hassiacum]